jgi:hypothetical protein
MDENEKYLSYEIEFSYGNKGSRIRYIYWRVKPHQLKWSKRCFCNKWQQLYRCCVGKWNPFFTVEEFINEVKPCKTVADIKQYINEQQNIINNYLNYLKPWPKNPNE